MRVIVNELYLNFALATHDDGATHVLVIRPPLLLPLPGREIDAEGCISNTTGEVRLNVSRWSYCTDTGGDESSDDSETEESEGQQPASAEGGEETATS